MSAAPAISLGGLRASGKLKAAGIHLAISTAMVAGLAAALLSVYFPMPYLRFDGGWKILQVLIVVDLVLGPSLTLLVYRRGKPRLVRDLTLIAAVQAAAFAYGAATLVVHRTSFLVLYDSTFYAMTMPQAKQGSFDRARTEALHEGSAAPIFVELALGPDARARARAQDSARTLDVAIVQLGDYYRPLGAADAELIRKSGRTLQAVSGGDPEIERDLAKFREKRGGDLSGLSFIPMIGRDGVAMGVFDAKTGAVVDWLL